MRKILLAAGFSTLAVSPLSAMALAQDASATTTPVPPPTGTTTVTTTDTAARDGSTTLTVQQQTVFATWPSERRDQYEAWPVDYRTYYWTLTPVQQEGYWALTADQRGQIYKMTPQQRTAAWIAIQQQRAGRLPSTPAGQANPPGRGMPTAGVPDPRTANQAAQPAMPADESYQGGPYKGALTPPPAAAMDKSYPVCSKTVTDGCRNRGSK